MSSGIGLQNNTLTVDIKSAGVIKKDAYLVAEAIHRLLNTTPYERPRESFGCRIKEILFQPNDFLTATLGAWYIENALNQYEPRASIQSIRPIRDDEKLSFEVIFKMNNNPNQLLATIVAITL